MNTYRYDKWQVRDVIIDYMAFLLRWFLVCMVYAFDLILWGIYIIDFDLILVGIYIMHNLPQIIGVYAAYVFIKYRRFLW